jgi:hypothetical protein
VIIMSDFKNEEQVNFRERYSVLLVNMTEAAVLQYPMEP